ncbi:Carbamoyl-phosphate synthase [ammonia], mitochondrial [Holothuria leucospilota]|uniref:Carbamoyl-phosphate synthase [ammonia], mitochondrial n=1 Tax=Holothuria leucospilota TaxID=206669 RepID=A0A9Q0Y8J6_HOLLE|nr:Carbamoyl-phosphate synthase [ammonia], mitochondrial [Holothuria leucospilota]
MNVWHVPRPLKDWSPKGLRMFCSPLLQLFATEKTAKYLQDHNIPASTVVWPLAVIWKKWRENIHLPPGERGECVVLEKGILIQERTIGLVINLPNHNTKFVKDNYLIRRFAVDSGVPLLTNFELFATDKTAKYLQDRNIPASAVAWPLAVMEGEGREYPPATRYYKTVVGELLTNLLKNSFQITTDACRRNGALACNFLHLVSSPFSNLPDTNKGFEMYEHTCVTLNHKTVSFLSYFMSLKAGWKITFQIISKQLDFVKGVKNLLFVLMTCTSVKKEGNDLIQSDAIFFL